MTGGIPDELYSLTNLEELYLGENQLSGVLSPKIGQLAKLRIIWLHNNQLTGPLPSEIGNLKQLTEFRVAKNLFFGTIPETIGNWTKLESLSLDNNAFEGMLPNAICKFINFSALYVNNNKLTSLPDSIGNLSNLQQIIANNNLISSIPASINKLSKLYRLDLMDNKLTSLPDMGTMPALWSLNLANNQIAVLPESFGKLVKISELNLSNNKLTQLPTSLVNLTTLTDISLNANKLSVLPFTFSILRNLKHLYLQNNAISGALPPLKHLGLKDLWLNGNRLIFSDIASSLMPDDSIYTDDYTFLYYDQAKVPLKDSVFTHALGDSVAIDIRAISRLSHPYNVYKWFKENKLLQTGPILKFPDFKETQKGTYICRISNPKYKRNLTELETNPISLRTKGDSIYTDGLHTSTRLFSSNEVYDYNVTLVVPDGVRGTVTWQASVDSLKWYVVSDTLSQKSIKQNISSITGSKIQLTPKSPVLFRYMVKEEACDPIISDAIRIKPIGVLVMDTLVNVKDKDLTIKKDSIEIVLPANLSSKDFKLVIYKLIDKPAAPDSVNLSEVYDINVSCGNVFETPLLIKFKNIKKKAYNLKDLRSYKGVYYDEQSRKWVDYPNSYICLKDTSLVLHTNHLTKIAWYHNNGYFSGFEYIFTSGRVNVIYNDYDIFKIYAKDLAKEEPDYLSTHSWLTSDVNPVTGAPLVIQDIAAYTNQIINAYAALGLDKLSSLFNFNVYVSSDYGEEGQTGFGSNSIGRGYICINPQYLLKPAKARTVLAHEFAHFEQDYYMQQLMLNYFWMEANAPLSDRMVWDVTKHKVPEPEDLLNQSLVPNSNGILIFNTLARSWDHDYNNIFFISKFLVNSGEANMASLFLHYMRSYRPDFHLSPSKLLAETPNTNGWVDYLDSFIKEYLLSNVGDEFENYVKYLLEGSNRNFTLQDTAKDVNPLRYLLNPSDFVTNKVSKFNSEKVLEDNIKLNVPSLAAKMVQMNNANPNQKLIVKYKRKSLLKNPKNMGVNVCKYDFSTKKMIFEDISALDSGVVVIDAQGPNLIENKHLAYFLFTNKGKTSSLVDDVNYDLKVYNVPTYSMLDDVGFFEKSIAGTWGDPLAIHSIFDGTKETLSELYITPQIFRRFHPNQPMSYSSSLTDSTYITHASSQWIDQTVTYNFYTGVMTIQDQENWGGLSANSPFDKRELTMVLGNVWLTPNEPNSIGITFSSDTNNTVETQKVVKSISYVRKHAWWNEQSTPPGLDPIVTETYVRTNYSSNNIILHLQFY